MPCWQAHHALLLHFASTSCLNRKYIKLSAHCTILLGVEKNVGKCAFLMAITKPAEKLWKQSVNLHL